ncbi:MAG: hypothetical protein IH609_18840 [Dehalococcoidia bacterium]|nr:hypothetical protein [Dehalococcoidia bacterium]
MIEPSEQRFEVRRFADGERIPWHEGMFAMETDTGNITGYRFSRPQGGEETTVSPHRLVGEKWVLAQLSPEGSSRLHDRDSGQTWKYPSSALRLKAASPDRLVFAELVPGDDGAPGRETGLFRVFSAGMVEVAHFELPPQQGPNDSQALVRANFAAIVPDPLGRQVVLANLETGATRAVFEPAPNLEGKPFVGMGISDAGNGAFLATVQYREAADNTGGIPTFVLQRIRWDGALLEATQTEGWYWHDSVSPDGKYRLHQETLFARPGVGEGSGELWPALSLRTVDGTPILRIRSAATQYGDSLPDNRWLADGMHFVAEFRGDDPNVWGGGVRYGNVSLDGRITYLPSLPLPVDDWYVRPQIAGPVPSPRDAGLFSFGRFYLYNASADRWFLPNLEDKGGPAHWGGQDSPWFGRPGEMIFSLGHGGHGGGVWPTLIEPLVEDVPFAASPPMRFTVARTGSCLNVRESWREESALVDCLADGTRVTLDPVGAQLWENAGEARYSATQDAQRTWVMVRTPAGEAGWVASEYLDWSR